eukprot:2308660-Amphidinium_carterae.1
MGFGGQNRGGKRRDAKKEQDRTLLQITHCGGPREGRGRRTGPASTPRGVTFCAFMHYTHSSSQCFCTGRYHIARPRGSR